MDISALEYKHKLYVFLSTRWTIIGYILLAITGALFFILDIEYTKFNQIRIESNLGVILTIFLISIIFWMGIYYRYTKTMSFFRHARITMGKGFVDAESETIVRGYRKAYFLKVYYEVQSQRYVTLSRPVTQVNFDTVYDLPVIYDPARPESAKLLAELSPFILKTIARDNGFEYT